MNTTQAALTWTGTSGHTYALYELLKTWDQAKTFATSAGGYLVKVDTSYENTEIFTNLNNFLSPSQIRNSSSSAMDGGGATYVWLGASDAVSEGNWKWVYDNSTLLTSRISRPEWGTGSLGTEPDNYSNQDSLAMGLENWPYGYPGVGFGSAGQWNDLNGSNTLWFVVEFDSSNNSSFDTTAPVLSTSLSSPGNNELYVAVGNNITLAFDESITKNTAKGAGTIQLKLGTKVIETYAMTSNLLTWSSDSVTINPAKDLTYAATYTVQVNTNAIKDTAGNSYAGGSLSFTTDDIITVSSSLTKYTLPATINKMAYTGSSNFAATGNANNNTITTGSGNDTLDGGKGNDTLIGGEGVDTYLIDSLSDRILESSGGGTDIAKINIATANGTYTLAENVENATLVNKVAFNLLGNDLSNILTGNAANNVLSGGDGYDTLIGGLGNDTLTGGSNVDFFEFNTALGANNIDTITDFISGEDILILFTPTFKNFSANDISNSSLSANAFLSIIPKPKTVMTVSSTTHTQAPFTMTLMELAKQRRFSLLH